MIRRCLEKERDDRFHSAHDLGLALELLGTTSDPTMPALARAEQPAAASPAGVPRRRALVQGASALALVAAGFAGGRFLGGAKPPALPAFHRLTFRRGLIRSARFAPDGEMFFYSALWEGGPCRIYSGRMSGTESVPLDLPDAMVQAVSRSGELAITVGPHRDGIITYGTLARAPMGGGAPRELAIDVKSADWSPDGQELAVVRQVDGQDRLEYPIGQVRFAPEGPRNTGMSFVRVSPDGQRIAFVHTTDVSSITGVVTIVDREGKTTALTDEYVNIHGLTWKGDQLWYTASDDRPLFRSIRAVRPGHQSRLVVRMPTNVTVWDANTTGGILLARTDDRAVMTTHVAGDTADRDLSWLDASWAVDIARDGSVILFNETGQGGGQQSPTGASTFSVFLRNVDGSAPVLLATGEGLALSPDKRWALVSPVALSFGGTPEYLDVIPTGAGESRRLPMDGFTPWRTRWLPDGRQVVVWGHGGDKGVVLLVIDVGSGERRVLAPDRVREFAVSPDGRSVAANVSGRLGIYPVEGGPPRQGPADAKGDLIGWITDGLLFTGALELGELPGDVHLVDPASGRRRRWTNIQPRDAAGVMLLLREFVITPDGRSWAYTWHRALSDLYLASGLVG